MIVDHISRIGLYQGMHPNLDRVIDALKTLDLAGMENGRHEVYNEDVFVNIMATKLSPTNGWEAHQTYADLQLVLKNTEFMDYAPIEDIQGFTSSDKDRDIMLSQDPLPGTRVKVGAGMFALFFPEDAHRPGIGEGEGRKAVFKIRMQPLPQATAPETGGLNHLGSQTLKTPRLLLREFRVSDAEAMFANWASDPEVTKTLMWDVHADVDVTRALLTDWVTAYQSGKSYHWAIEMQGELIGDISMMSWNGTHGFGEIGYCLSKAYWNQGIMTEALKAVLNFLFSQVGFRRIYLRHVITNFASGKVMEKAGLLPEGIARQMMRHKHDGFVDIQTWAALKDEWLAQQESIH